MEIELTPEILAELLDYNPETGELIWKPRDARFFKSDAARKSFASYEGTPALTSRNACGHRRGNVLGRHILAHRAAWAIYYGEWPQHEIDHINGKPDDNRIVNLRDVPHEVNTRNAARYKNNKTGFSGIVKIKGRWIVRVGGGSLAHVGTFDDFDEALAARNQEMKARGYTARHGRA